MHVSGVPKRRVVQLLTAVVTALCLVLTAGAAAQATLTDPVPNKGTTLGGTEASLVVGVTMTQITRGYTHAVALGSDGNMYAWGNNSYGQLGDGTQNNRSTPVLVSRGDIPTGVTITELVTEAYHSVVLGSDGNMYAWGRNNFGQLGDGTTTHRFEPVLVARGAIPEGVAIDQLASGDYHNVVIGSDGNIYSWGRNVNGQLGDGTTTNKSVPVVTQRGSIPAGVDIEQVTAGLAHSIFLASNGNMYALGRNDYGQLGDGTTTNRFAPVLVVRGVIPAEVTIEYVRTGYAHSAVLGSDGNIYSWGWNTSGQLGDGTTTNRTAPIQVLRGVIPTGVVIDELVLGGTFSLIVASNGNMYTWGANQFGSLGDGTMVNRSVPVQVVRGVIPSGVTIEGVAAGESDTLVEGSDGQIYSWGRNYYGQLGDGSTINRISPVAVQRGQIPEKIVTMTQVIAGENHSVGVGSDGNLYSWGRNNYGQLGDGSTIDRATPELVSRGEIPPGVTFQQIAAGAAFSLVSASNGNIYAWGQNDSGQLGDGTTTDQPEPVQVLRGAIPPDTSVTQIEAGEYHAVVLDSDGDAFAWGQNSSGALGDGSRTDRAVPVAVQQGAVPTGVKLRKLAADRDHSLGLGSDGNVYAWGQNDYGQLGNGTLTDSEVPVRAERVLVPSGVVFRQIAAGFEHSLAIGSDGNVYSWGRNDFGQLGDSSITGRTAPGPVQRGALPTGVRIVQLAAGDDYSAGLGADGNLYSWGQNTSGQLGDGSTAGRIIPVLTSRGAIPAGVSIAQYVAGASQSVAVAADGNVYAWGKNDYGQLGDGTVVNRMTPTPTSFVETVTGVSFGGVPGTSVSQNVDGVVTAVTPAHPAGVVDVAVSWSLNGVAQPVLSRPQSFTYVDPPAFTTDPSDQEVAAGSTGSFTVVTDADASVVWHVLTEAGGSWNPVVLDDDVTVSANGRTLTVLGTVANDGYQYRAVATNSVASTTSAAAVLTVVTEPGFTTNPADQTVPVGGDAVFTVATDVAATVTWEVQQSGVFSWAAVVPGAGVTVSADGLTLTVTGAVSNDENRYRAVASNIAGSVKSAAADLRVIGAPRFEMTPVNQTVGVGSTATFAVETSVAADVVWEVSDDGGVSWGVVSGDPAATVSGDGLELYVVAALVHDGHLYRAVASNIAGSVTSDAGLLRVVPTPGFVRNPADQVVASGEPAVFEVETDALAVSVSWLVSVDDGASWVALSADPSAVLSADGLTLTVTASAANDGYRYRAVASNIGGTSPSGSAMLTVVELTEFVTDPVDQEVPSGSTAEFSVVAPAADEVTWELSSDTGVTWAPVVPGSDETVSVDGLTLQVVGNTAKNGYLYRAVATNIAGTVRSAAATLTVVEEPVFTLEPVDQEVVAGAPAVFTVTTDIAATVVWEVSSAVRSAWAPVVPGAGVTVSADGRTLTVIGNAGNDENYYRAIASNIAGETYSDAAQLRLIVAPTFITNPVDQPVASGSDAVFTAATDVAATVTWAVQANGAASWDQVVADAGVTVSADGLTLTITGTATNNGSRYRAVATNIAGTDTSTAALLTVVEVPVVITAPVNTTVVAGDPAVLSVAVSGADIIEWESSADGGTTWAPADAGEAAIVSDDGLTLTVTGSAANDGRQYRAVASNLAGTVISAAATLTVISAPQFVTEPVAQSVAGGDQAVFTVATDVSATVVWQMSADGGVTWVSASADTSASTSIDGLTLTVTGSAANNGNLYRALAANAAGTTTSAAAQLTVEIDPGPGTGDGSGPGSGGGSGNNSGGEPGSSGAGGSGADRTGLLSMTGDGVVMALWGAAGLMLMVGAAAVMMLRHRRSGG